MAIRFDNIEAINLLNNQGEQTIALTNDQGIIVSGNVAMATGNATGKFAVKSTGVHASYDFYNDGTSYFNGGVTVDAGLSQTGGADATFSGDVGIGITNPAAKLHVSDSGSTTSVFIGNTGSGVSRAYLDASNGDFSGSDYMWIGQNNDLSGEITMTQNAGSFHIKTQPSGTITSQLSVSQNGTITFGSYGAGILKTNASGVISVDTTAYAALASPALTGTPTAPTAGATTNTTQLATTAFVQTAVSSLIDSAPSTLDTLNELAAALGDDASFSTTVTNSIATKLPLAGGTMTGSLQLNNTLSVGSGNSRFIWNSGDVSVTGAGTDNGVEIDWKNGTHVIPSLAYAFRVKLVVTGTGTDSGASYVVYYNNTSSSWVVRYITLAGTSSNHPLLSMKTESGVGTYMIAYHNHSSTYSIRYWIETFDSGDQDMDGHTFGSDFQWQRDNDTLTYADGNVQLPDNNQLRLGAGNDLRLYHNGTDSFIDDAGTGDLRIRSNFLKIEKYTGETMATFNDDNAVSLYYDNNTRLETSSSGVNVTGDLTVSDVRTGSSGGLNLGDDSSILSIGRGNEIWTQNDVNGSATLYVNYRGYNGGSTQFRSLDIRDGKAGQIASFNGSDKSVSFAGNAAFAGAVSTGGYLTLNSSDDIPRLIFNGSGDDFMFSNTANYFGLYNDTDSRWDIQVDGAGTATFGGAINATSGSFTGETHIGSVSDGPFTALRLMNQKTYGSGTGTNEKVRFAMGIAESGIAYSGREGFVIDVGIGDESDSSNAVINFQARDGGVIGTYQTVNGHDKSVEFVGQITSAQNQITTNIGSTSAIRLKPASTTDTTGKSSIFLGTSIVDNYGISLRGARLGTNGEPTFEIATHLNSANGTVALSINNSQNATFAGTIGATNFSGSSSGTNTGDQVLPTANSLGAVTLTGTQTITGNKTFSNTANYFNGHLYYTAYDAAGNHYPHFLDGSSGGGTTVNWRQYYGTSYKTHTWISDASGNMTFTFQGDIDANGGDITADNFSGSSSGTNTGDQDLSGYLTSVPSEYLTQTEGDARYVSFENANRAVPSTGGWRKLLKIGRGGARVAISYTGGNFTPTTYVVDAYKDWSATGTLSVQVFGQAAWINGFRIIQEAGGGNGDYYLQANFKNISNSHSFECYYQELIGYDSISEIFAVSSGSTLPASNSSGKTAIESINVTDNQEGSYVKNLDVSGRLYLDTVDTSTALTDALVLTSGGEVEKRTLGSNAFNSTTYITSQRAISSTPTDGATTTAISSDWAFDNVKTAVPANALFTDANTTYSAGSGLDLTGTTFSVETDLRDGITHVGKDTSNFIQFDSTEETITFIVGGNAVAVMQSDGDLHIKGDVIAFSDIFNP